MSTVYAHPGRSWLGRAEDWLDDRGKPAWIAAMVLGFIVFWPVGLALLAYMIWSKRMFSRSCGAVGRQHDHHAMRKAWMARQHGFRTSGNSAFDAYKADTLDRLEREQGEFESFLKRLRDSKDKAEFDQYLDDRAKAARDAEESPDAKGGDEDGDTGRGRY